MKNKALGVLVSMEKIMQVLGSYKIKRCNKLSLGGSLRDSMKKKVASSLLYAKIIPKRRN